MAARWLQTRLLSYLACKQFPTSLSKEASSPSIGLSNRILRYTIARRGILTQSEASTQGSKVAEKAEVCSSKPSCSRTEVAPHSNNTDAQTAARYNVSSDLKVSSRHDLAMIFTCKVCETRSMKTCCRESYENGVVVVRCGGCNNLHVIADRLGWFGEPGSVEDLLAARGEGVKKGSVDSLNLTPEDLAGKDV